MPRRSDQPPPWPHAPTHLLDAPGIYFVTASTYQKEHHFRDPTRLEVLHRGLLTVTHQFGWRLEAWAVFPITTTSSPNRLQTPAMPNHSHR